jgi:hypothetical protein
MHALRTARTTVAIACMKRTVKAVLNRILAAIALRSTPRSAPRVEGARAVKRRGRTPIMYTP